MTDLDRAAPALTEQRPWGYAIIHLGKSVENRTWATKYRGPLFIHQGKGLDPGAAFFEPMRQAWRDRNREVETPDPDVAGAILGGVILADCHHQEPGCCASDWALPGVWHWVLTGPWALPEPVPAKGALGLWHPQADVLGQLAGASS